MNDLEQRIATAWEEAQGVLGIGVVTPFSLVAPDSSLIDYIALVQNFGADNGMLLLCDQNNTTAMQLAVSKGYGYSCLNKSYSQFDKDLFIDTLNDWGWIGSNKDAPDWYTGEPKTSEHAPPEGRGEAPRP